MRLLPHVEPGHRVLYAPLLASFVLFGIDATILGATVPVILGELSWSKTTAGAIMAAGSAGYLLSAFASGVIVRRVGPKRVIVTGMALQAVGLALFGVWDSVPAAAALWFVAGVGKGSLELVVNVCVVRMERNGQSRLMNLVHSGFSVGAIVGPLAVGALLAGGANWRWAFRGAAVAAAALGVVLWTLPFRRLEAAGDAAQAHAPTRQIIAQPLLIVCFLILLLYVAAELGVSAWVATYFVQVRGAPLWLGAAMPAVFWAGLLIGRLGLSAVYHGTRQDRLLLALSATCTAGLIAALLAPGWWPSAAGFFVAGLGFSAIYPAVMALVGTHFARGQSVAVGFAGAGGGVGSLVGPFLIAAIGDGFGLEWGLCFCIGLSAAMLALVGGATRLTRQVPAGPTGVGPGPT